MQRMFELILLALLPGGSGQSKMAYIAGDGASANFFEISTCECKDDGTVVLQAPASFFPYGLSDLEKAVLPGKFESCGTIELIDSSLLQISTTVSPNCGVVYVDNALPKIEVAGLSLTQVDLVIDLEIAARTFQAAVACSCPEPQEGFFHDDENFVAEISFPCEFSICIYGGPTVSEFAQDPPSLEVIEGDTIRFTKAWDSFTSREMIQSDMGTLYILKFKLTYIGSDAKTTRVQDVFMISPKPAKWSEWGQWGECVLPEYSSGELDGTRTRTRVCENQGLNADWKEKCPDGTIEMETCFGGCRYDEELEGSTPCEQHSKYIKCCAASTDILLRTRRGANEPNCPEFLTYDFIQGQKIGCYPSPTAPHDLVPVLFPEKYLSSAATVSVNAGSIISFKELKTRYFPAELVQIKESRKVNVRLWVRNSAGTCVPVWAWPNSIEITTSIAHNYNIVPHRLSLTFANKDFLLSELELEQLSPVARCMNLHSYGEDMILESHEVLFAAGAYPITKLQYLAVDGDVLKHEEKTITLKEEKYWAIDELGQGMPSDESWLYDSCPAIAECPETTGTCPECSSSEPVCNPDTFFSFGTKLELEDGRTIYEDHPVCATTSGVVFSHFDLSALQMCGACAADQCNTISYNCHAGAAEVQVHGCPPSAGCDLPTCTDIPWSEWGSCDKSTCQLQRARDVLSVEDLYKLDCKLPETFETVEFKPCQDVPPTCRRDIGIEIVCDDFDKVRADSCTSCSSSLNGYCKYQSNVEQCYDNCVEIVECDHCCNSLDFLESSSDSPPICNTDHQCSAGLWTQHMKSSCSALATEYHASVHHALCTTDDTTECSQCPSDLSLYECVGEHPHEPQPCIVSQSRAPYKPVKICWLKASRSGYCEVHAPCEPDVCEDSSSKNCRHSDTKSCELTHRIDANLCSGTKLYVDRFGDLIYGSALDCCANLPTCSSDELAECDPCAYLASEYNCLSPFTKTMCPSSSCQVLANTCPCSPAGICHFDPEAADVEIMTLSNTLFHQIGYELPDERFHRSVKFFISGTAGNSGINAENPACFLEYTPNQELALTFSRADLQDCGVELDIEKNKLRSFYAHIFVDKLTYFDAISAHSEFAELNCKSWQADLEEDARAMANYEATRFSDIAQGAVNVQFDLSTSEDFTTVLDAEANTATVVVGEFVYARITGDSPFEIVNCEIIGGEGQVFTMLDGVCPSHVDWQETFMFEYIEQEDTSKIFKWQSVIFREGEQHQQVTYACSVRPCEAGGCDSCDANGRRRRSAEERISHNAPASNVGMLLDIFATQEERDRVLGIKEMQLAKDVGVTVTAALMFLASMVGTLMYLFSDPSYNSRRGFYPVMTNPWASLQKVFLRRVPQPTPELRVDAANNENNFIKNVDLMLQPDADFVIKSLTPPEARKPRVEDFE